MFQEKKEPYLWCILGDLCLCETKYCGIVIDRGKTARLKRFGDEMLLEEFRIRGEKRVICGAPNLRLLFAPTHPSKKCTNLHKSA